MLASLLRVFTYGDFIPFLRCFDFGGFEKKMKNTGMEMDILLSRWLEEHKAYNNSSNHDIVEQDFTSVLPSILDNYEEAVSTFDSDTINKAMCMVLITGGVDSTTVTMIWALTLLITNPKALIRAQDAQTCGQRKTSEKLGYRKINLSPSGYKRNFAPTPTGSALTTTRDNRGLSFGGFIVTSGTLLYLNLWKFHRDPRVWSEPNEFRPERFLNEHKEVDVRGKSFELLPFGGGRRVCVRITSSLRILHFVLASLLHSFEFTPLVKENVDINVSNVDILTKLRVRLTPRLGSNLYG